VTNDNRHRSSPGCHIVSAMWHPESASKTKGRWDSEWPLVVVFPHRTWNPRQKENGGRGACAHQNEQQQGIWLPSHLQRCGTWISYQKIMGEGGVLLSWLAPWLYYPPRSHHLVGPSCGCIVLMGARLLCDMSASDMALACHSCCIWGMQWSLRAVGEDHGWWWPLVRVAMRRRWMVIVDNGGGRGRSCGCSFAV